MRPISPILSTPSVPIPRSGPLGWFPTWIVGRRYYDAVPTPGWHGQLLALWQRRAGYTCHALDAFRAEVRDLVHSGRLWPETQLFYRLLKGVVADGEAAEAYAREIAAKLAAEAEAIRRAAETAALRTAFACEACGPLLPFGHLSVLPLRALRPATVTPLTEALRTGAAALTLKKTSNGASAFEVLLTDDARVLAVGGERLDTTAGAFRIAKDTLIESSDTPYTLHAVADGDDAPNRRTPVFLNGAATVEPPLPALPPDAAGFAVFRGGERLHVTLYAHPACAVAALTGLRRMTWHLRPSRPALSAEAAFAALAPIFNAAPFTSAPPFARFDATPGLKGEARLFDGKEVAYLRIAINESEK